MAKQHEDTPDAGLGLRQHAGPVTCGSQVYYFLPEGSPNAGKPRPATVIRAYQNEERNAAGTLPEAVDLFVMALAGDGIVPNQTQVPKTSVGTRDFATWDFQAPQESGF